MGVRWKYGLAFYAIAGIVTFGYAAAHSAQKHDTAVAQCKNEQTKQISFCWEPDVAAPSGIAAAVAWPLYWSWEAWS